MIDIELVEAAIPDILKTANLFKSQFELTDFESLKIAIEIHKLDQLTSLTDIAIFLDEKVQPLLDLSGEAQNRLK